jgi:hypothetical protein
MVRSSLMLIVAGFLMACSGPNTGLNTLQLSGEALPFPENYQVEAARIVRDRGGDIAVARVSRPQQTVGLGVMTPKLWYVCISGLPEPKADVDVQSDRLPPLMDLVDDLVYRRAASTRYEIVLLFSAEDRRPSVRDGWDSQLCQGAAFEQITASPPTAETG